MPPGRDRPRVGAWVYGPFVLGQEFTAVQNCQVGVGCVGRWCGSDNVNVGSRLLKDLCVSVW